MRFGVILTARGGALAKMRAPFALGLGGPIGDGRQGVSWIALDDAIYAIHHLIRNDGLSGPVNVVAPQPLPQREFARALGPRVAPSGRHPSPGAGRQGIIRTNGRRGSARRTVRRAESLAEIRIRVERPQPRSGALPIDRKAAGVVGSPASC
jgi:nucleoside-diphosphate-sugar epimerase